MEIERKERIKKIKHYSIIERYRHHHFYHTLESYQNSEELKWIHSMSCYCLMEESDTDTIIYLISVIQQFEKEIEWYHQKGIDDSISSLKEILSDKFIPYSELYDEEEDEEDEEEEEEDEEIEEKVWIDLESSLGVMGVNSIKDYISVFKSKL
jgi:hypothetical protein